MASLDGGYDYVFVSCTTKSLECSICLLTVRDPHVSSCCGNQFCYVCINRIQQDDKPCPLCNESSFTTFLHKGVAREIKAMKVYCPEKTQGCDWQGELGQVKQHLNPAPGSGEIGCSFVIVDCMFQCGRQFRRGFIRNHEAEGCSKRPAKTSLVQDEMALLREHLNSLATENLSFKKDIKVLQQENRDIQKRNLGLEAQVSSLMKQVEIHSPPTSVPPFYFTIVNFEHYKNINYEITSPSFYSHLGGYKMFLQIFPNGEGAGFNTHLSVHLCIMRGEYDDKLRWPLKATVHFHIYNCISRKWVFHTFISLKNVIQPLECICNAPNGLSKFLANWRLTQEILHCDRIRLRVAKVELH